MDEIFKAIKVYSKTEASALRIISFLPEITPEHFGKLLNLVNTRKSEVERLIEEYADKKVQQVLLNG